MRERRGLGQPTLSSVCFLSKSADFLFGHCAGLNFATRLALPSPSLKCSERASDWSEWSEWSKRKLSGNHLKTLTNELLRLPSSSKNIISSIMSVLQVHLKGVHFFPPKKKSERKLPSEQWPKI